MWSSVLFGRRTYEAFAGHWPTVGDDDPVGRSMNHARKLVATSSSRELTWSGAEPLCGDVGGQISRLKGGDGTVMTICARPARLRGRTWDHAEWGGS